MGCNNTCTCECIFKHSLTNEEVDSSVSSNVLHMRKRTKRVAGTSKKKAESRKKAETEPVGNMTSLSYRLKEFAGLIESQENAETDIVGNMRGIGYYRKEFVDLLEGACRRDTSLIDLGSVTNRVFWYNFVNSFNGKIKPEVPFMADDSQQFARLLKEQYKTDRHKLSEAEWNQLSRIFGHKVPSLGVWGKSISKTKTRSSKSGNDTGNSIGNNTCTSERRSSRSTRGASSVGLGYKEDVRRVIVELSHSDVLDFDDIESFEEYITQSKSRLHVFMTGDIVYKSKVVFKFHQTKKNLRSI